jgi:hypothetical protein
VFEGNGRESFVYIFDSCYRNGEFDLSAPRYTFQGPNLDIVCGMYTNFQSMIQSTAPSFSNILFWRLKFRVVLGHKSPSILALESLVKCLRKVDSQVLAL